ncbi:hypothetical protein S1OALGB6SA_1301 [Olavius algarvensis spirochete endosymbiont]|nr:MAG: hypothetical protein [Olavius algarvensis spirochete endosymbiont]VDB00226.1 hypothetical protein S1OALGB6SA_1301 [Olavius algarvensis spirochete endosymbiont]
MLPAIWSSLDFNSSSIIDHFFMIFSIGDEKMLCVSFDRVRYKE